MVRFEAAAAAEEQEPAAAANLGRPAQLPCFRGSDPPRAPDPVSRPGHGPALRPRAPRLLSGARARCGGQEAGGGRLWSRVERLRSRKRNPRPEPRAPRPVPAALARAARSPDEPRWPGLNPECTPCNSSPCACPTASRRAPNSSSGMMTPLLLLQLF